MKKSAYITLIFVLVSAAGVMAQSVSFVASFGAARSWDVPPAVAQVVYHDYYQYDWVHAARFARHGHWNYNIILQRGHSFIELNVNRFGHVRRVRAINQYPLAGHVCGAHCGFHSYYYNSFRVSCNSPFHYGHNHVIYRPRPVNYVWGHYQNYPSYNKVVYRNRIHDHPPKYYKELKKNYRHVERDRDQRYVHRKSYPSRREGTVRELERSKRSERHRGEKGERSRGRKGRR